MQTYDFRSRVESFSEWWPIFSVQDVRKKRGRDAPFQFGSREEFYAAHIRSDIKRSPQTWVHGQQPRWHDLVTACYRVRCNLFHGDKSMGSPTDERIVATAADCLSFFIHSADLYQWADERPPT
jgi:hypothetical protein